MYAAAVVGVSFGVIWDKEAAGVANEERDIRLVVDHDGVAVAPARRRQTVLHERARNRLPSSRASRTYMTYASRPESSSRAASRIRRTAMNHFIVRGQLMIVAARKLTQTVVSS